jgi:hypothetical protein
MDIDIIIVNILRFVSRSQIRKTCFINRHWQQIISYLYPKRFTWNDNSLLIDKISKKQQNQFKGVKWRKLNDVFCRLSGLTIFLLLNENENKLYVAFEDLIFHQKIYHPLPSSVKSNSKLLHFFLPKLFSTDFSDHLVLLLKYNNEENTFLDYSDLTNIVVFQTGIQYSNFFTTNSIHYALCESLFLFDFYLGQTTLADFPLINIKKLCTLYDDKIQKRKISFHLNTDGSIFIIYYLKNSTVFKIYKGDNFIQDIFMPELPELVAHYYVVCFHFTICCQSTSFEIYDIYSQKSILKIPKDHDNYLCKSITLTTSHFLIFVGDKNKCAMNDTLYYIVDIGKKTYKRTYYFDVVVFGCKVEQIDDTHVIVHYRKTKNHRTVAINLDKLSFGCDK